MALILSFQVGLVFFLGDLQVLMNSWRVVWAGRILYIYVCVGIKKILNI